MSKVIKAVGGKYREIELNNLYKNREDNKLTTEELIDKYEDRIVDGTIPSRKIEHWEIKVQEISHILEQINKDIEHINKKLRDEQNL